jgi:hypothetical protein
MEFCVRYRMEDLLQVADFHLILFRPVRPLIYTRWLSVFIKFQKKKLVFKQKLFVS